MNNLQNIHDDSFSQEIREICHKYSIVLQHWRNQKLAWIISQITTIIDEAEEISK